MLHKITLSSECWHVLKRLGDSEKPGTLEARRIYPFEHRFFLSKKKGGDYAGSLAGVYGPPSCLPTANTGSAQVRISNQAAQFFIWNFSPILQHPPLRKRAQSPQNIRPVSPMSPVLLMLPFPGPQILLAARPPIPQIPPSLNSIIH